MCVKQTKSGVKIEEPKPGQDILNICKYVHWLYKGKIFDLSAVRLQPLIDKNGENDNFNYVQL